MSNILNDILAIKSDILYTVMKKILERVVFVTKKVEVIYVILVLLYSLRTFPTVYFILLTK